MLVKVSSRGQLRHKKAGSKAQLRKQVAADVAFGQSTANVAVSTDKGLLSFHQPSLHCHRLFKWVQ